RLARELEARGAGSGVLLDVRRADLHDLAVLAGLGLEADERRDEPRGLRERERGGGETRRAELPIDAEGHRPREHRAAADAAERAQRLGVRARRERNADRTAEIAGETRGDRSLRRDEQPRAAARR